MTEEKVYNLDVSKKLGNVRVFAKGLTKIKYSTISKDIEKLKDSKNLGELLTQLQQAHQSLDRLGVFKGLTTNVVRGDQEGDVDVVFTFEEKPAFYTVGANVNSKTKAGIELKGEIPGVFGSSNTLTLSANTAGTGNNELTGSYFIPRLPLLDKFTGLFSVFTSYNDLKKYCSYTNRIKGFKFILSSLSQKHNFTWESCIRDIYPVYNNKMKSSEMVLRNSGCSLKNSLSYVYKHDNTTGDGVPTQGHLTQIKIETGLPGGDCLFFKLNYNLSFSKLLFQQLIMNMNVGFGYLYNFGNYNKYNNLLEKFNFSGPSGSHLAFRGFSFQGLGPYDHGFIKTGSSENGEWANKVDHLGGDYYTNMQLSLYYPFKFLNLPKFVQTFYLYLDQWYSVSLISDHYQIIINSVS
uniref:Bacterial surface antigen (D15) domain-containing protein n=1 Tax=Theileria annulata TaxID=5874 RepID=A0A3B0N9U3_THEAN